MIYLAITIIFCTFNFGSTTNIINAPQEELSSNSSIFSQPHNFYNTIYTEYNYLNPVWKVQETDKLASIWDPAYRKKFLGNRNSGNNILTTYMNNSPTLKQGSVLLPLPPLVLAQPILSPVPIYYGPRAPIPVYPPRKPLQPQGNLDQLLESYATVEYEPGEDKKKIVNSEYFRSNTQYRDLLEKILTISFTRSGQNLNWDNFQELANCLNLNILPLDHLRLLKMISLNITNYRSDLHGLISRTYLAKLTDVCKRKVAKSNKKISYLLLSFVAQESKRICELATKSLCKKEKLTKFPMTSSDYIFLKKMHNQFQKNHFNKYEGRDLVAIQAVQRNSQKFMEATKLLTLKILE